MEKGELLVLCHVDNELWNSERKLSGRKCEYHFWKCKNTLLTALAKWNPVKERKHPHEENDERVVKKF